MQVLDKLHLSAIALKQRRKGKDPFAIQDEYDVQDLLYAILLIFFNIKREQWAPSYLESSKKLDFLLIDEKIGIEVKFLSDSHTEKKIGDELLVDMPHYSGDLRCETLICYIYDPQCRLHNPTRFYQDLIKSKPPSLNLVVIVEPKR